MDVLVVRVENGHVRGRAGFDVANEFAVFGSEDERTRTSRTGNGCVLVVRAEVDHVWRDALVRNALESVEVDFFDVVELVVALTGLVEVDVVQSLIEAQTS